MSKYFLRLHFAVDQVLLSSGYDLKNERMPWKQTLNQKYLAKNSEPPLPFFENREQKPWFW